MALLVGSRGWRRTAAAALAGSCLLWAPPDVHPEPSFSESHVKATFLFNLAKYVEWPADAFETPTAPIIIGVLRADAFKAELERVVAAKHIEGRPLSIRHVRTHPDMARCHMIFISASDQNDLGHILNHVTLLPVVTVGEDAQFMQHGGVINFVTKDDKIRLEINLDATRRAGLEISSKLLSVANVVRGRSK